MEGEERPRKLAKLDHGESREEPEATMSGTVDAPELANAHNKNTEENDVSDNESSPANGEDGGSNLDQLPADDVIEGEEDPTKISKRQMKKLQRKEQWEAGREERKQKRREKVAARRVKKRAELREAKLEGKDATKEARKALESTKQRFERSKLLPITFILDCDFDELMHDKERISLAQQLTRCYSDNNKNPYRSHLVLSSFNKQLKERFDTVMGKMHEKWRGVRFFDEDHFHAAALAKEWMAGPEGGQMAGVFTDKTDAKPEDGEVVYLSSDSDNTLTELKPYSTYIIGGLVDKNRHKGICHKRAVEKGIKTAKLPIGQYIQMASRSVLTTNHVVEIMLRWLDVGDWGKAFMEVIPQRKGGVLRAPSEAITEEDQDQAEGEAGEAEDGEDVEENSEEGGKEDTQPTKEGVTEVNES